MKICYQVSRSRLGLGANPFKAFLRLPLNIQQSTSDESGCSPTKALVRSQSRYFDPFWADTWTVAASTGLIHGERKHKPGCRFTAATSWTGDRFRDAAVFQLVKLCGNLPGRCKILKQLADRNKYNSGEVNSRVVKQTLSADSPRFCAPGLELSESEAKFFLDRDSGTKNIDRKIFGDYSERAKFHLQAFGNLLNWRSYVLGWVGVSLYAHESARLRKAVSPKQGLSTTTFHQHQASGKKRLLGFFLFPANMEESDLNYESESEECGQKGDWSYCVIG